MPHQKGSGKLLILDTDILVDVQRGFPPAVEWLSSLDDPPTLTGFSVLELIQDSNNKEEVRRALRFVEDLPVIWPKEADYSQAIECFAKVNLSHSVGLLDLLIAFAVIGMDAELCTFNRKHFKAIPGLRILQPYKR